MSETETTTRTSRMDDESDEDASEAQAQVIASLRAQVTDLFSQVTQLNSKLVASYDRVSNLEDELHDASASLRNATVTISSLELERSHHLAALNTGLLVEKAHVTAELNRLMERATEEAAQRGQAESARQDIEKDLDDLSATLFDQANTMVAEARLNQARSERKVQDAEEALKIAEDAVKEMQVQMQTLQAEKEDAEKQAQEAKLTMGKGKWVERDELRVGEVPRIRLMTTHTPYAEFIAFVTHLRGLKIQQPTPPAMPTLLSQPFLARLLNEDSEPTVRLDLAPSLNWLSRRSVLAAIHTGMLTVEPVSFTNLLQELHLHSPSVSSTSVSCALCGTPIARLPPGTPLSRPNGVNGSSWFKYPLALSSPQNSNATTPQTADFELPGQVYIFRLAAATTAAPPPSLNPVHAPSASMPAVGTSSRPPVHPVTSSRVLPSQTQNSPYPLCTSNYCLTRLRSTCSLWAFVRVGIVERIWEEEIVQPPKSAVNGNGHEAPVSPATPASAGSQPTSATAPPSTSDKPPVPPRRRRLWEMASALGERAVSWGKEGGESAKEKEKGKEKEKESTRNLPPPPPTHPSVPHPHTEVSAPKEETQVPPPLPKRSVIRGRATTDTVVPPAGTHQNGTAAPETVEPTITTNGHLEPDKVDSNASSDSFATPVEEITFAAPTSADTSPSPFTTPYPVSTDTSAGAVPNEDQASSPSPHNIPLPETPTSAIPSRVTSPMPRPRSRVSSPASPPPASRAASPTVNRSRAGSPAGITRTTSPPPGHLPPTSHIRGKLSTSSPLGPSRSGSPAPAATGTGVGAPPVPRRAPARRAVPPPPTAGGEAVKEEVRVVVSGAEPSPETEARKEEAEGEKDKEKESAKPEDELVKEKGRVESATTPITDVAPAPEPESGANRTNGEAVTGDAQPSIESAPSQSPPSTTVPADVPPTSDPDTEDPVPSTDNPKTSGETGRTSIDTTSTKRSSSTEGEGYAGDTTWEERTWKEVVRLKEEMFWARIGGVRALRG